ncbi:zinc-binding dehydrogenase [Promicromonospora sp. NPDC090134]|uniref:zinc-binding dehydrogenase n=1 Tax=Promicromonospora sp. NPDC090134 TaxID=3364408 RepID=UPI00380A7FE2
MRRAHVRQGDVVLITAATSGVGLLGIQIAHILGAGRVIATTRRAARRGLLERADADHVIVTDEEDMAARALELPAVSVPARTPHPFPCPRLRRRRRALRRQ